MSAVLDDQEIANSQMRRDFEFAKYFNQFRPNGSNLYWKLAGRISQARKKGWSGTIVSFNHERLLEESLLKHEVFPVVHGVQFYSEQLPRITENKLLEVCYPHGACHLLLGINPFDLSKGGNVVLNQGINGGGINHILTAEKVEIALSDQYLPLICRYEPNKSQAIQHDYFNIQQERYKKIILGADTIGILGMYCSFENDSHIWGSIAQSKAKIIYYEPFEPSIKVFEHWVSNVINKSSSDYQIKKVDFKTALNIICRDLGIR